MKKSVIVLIALIYVLSIALVSFFGLQYKVFEEVIPVERVELLNEGLKDNDLWGKYVVIQADENGEWHYQIKYRVYPDEATNNQVKFTYDTQNTAATVDEAGVVTFTSRGMIKVTLIPLDGSDASATITIIAG